MNRSLAIIYATSTGHTEFVIDTLTDLLAKSVPELRISRKRAEVSKPEDLTKSDIVLLACGTWNTGNVEGQLNPFMHDFLMTRAADVDLRGIHAAAISLGDDRYRFTSRAGERLATFLHSHHASLLLPVLNIINEPFDQTAKVEAWCKEFTEKIEALPVAVPSKKK